MEKSGGNGRISSGIFIKTTITYTKIKHQVISLKNKLPLLNIICHPALSFLKVLTKNQKSPYSQTLTHSNNLKKKYVITSLACQIFSSFDEYFQVSLLAVRVTVSKAIKFSFWLEFLALKQLVTVAFSLKSMRWSLNFGNFLSHNDRITFADLLSPHRLVVEVTFMLIGVSVNGAE